MVGVGCHITAGDSGIATVILGGQSFVQHERSVKQPNPARPRTAAGRRGCQRRVSWPPSLSLGH